MPPPFQPPFPLPGSPWPAARGSLAGLLGPAVDLIYPSSCPGCGRYGVRICAGCLRELAGPAFLAQGRVRVLRAEERAPYLAAPVSAPAPTRRHEPTRRRDPAQPDNPEHPRDAVHPNASGQHGAIPVFAAGDYRGAPARAMLAWKSGARPDLRAEMQPIAWALGEHVGACLAPELAGRVLVVPAPSGRARRRLGREVVPDLARAVAQGLDGVTGPGLHVEMTQLLRRSGGREHLLGAAARAADRTRSIGLRAAAPGLVARAPGRRGSRADASGARPAAPEAAVVLVDDVVTTGATVMACREAVETLGVPVLCAVALLSTPAPRGRGRP